VKRILVFLALVTLFAGVFELAIVRIGSMDPYVFPLMWAPALAAFAACKLTGKPISSMGWGWGETRWQALSWGIPILYSVVAYLAVWATGFGGFPNHDFVQEQARHLHITAFPEWAQIATYTLMSISYGFLRSSASALGEEIGWRGFLVPELMKRFSFNGTVAIAGTAWLLYHVPILVGANYNAGTPPAFALACFAVLIYSGTAIFTWMRMRSGSLWAGVFLHGSHNIVIQGVLTPITVNTGKTAWAIDEFGIAVPAVMLLLAVYFWTRRGELPA
jgi:membrane protease YdiL (CAAX protease family)